MVEEFHLVLRHVRNFVFPLHANLRSKKVNLFFESFAPHPTDSLLDVGGCPGTGYASLHSFFADVALLNIRPIDHPKGILGNACKMSPPDKSFDWVFSNALIEHEGHFSKQLEMAEEVRRVARKGYFIPTPNRHFPIDPHTYIPFFHLMPEITIDRVAVGAYWIFPLQTSIVSFCHGHDHWVRDECGRNGNVSSVIIWHTVRPSSTPLPEVDFNSG